MITTNCLHCGNKFSVGHAYTTLETSEGYILDCPNCDAIHVIKQGRILDFHKWLHGKEPSWPVDGKGTGWIGFGEKE